MTKGYALTDDNGNVLNGAGNIISGTVHRSYGFTSQGIGAGTYYKGGFYDAPAASVALSQASPTQTHGISGNAYGAHAFIVASAIGTASGGSGTVEIEVSGTSVTDAGVETTSDTEIVVADITALATNTYMETTKKWTGQVTFTLQNAGGSTQTAFAATFNYGYAKYDDFGNRDFSVTQIEVVGLAGANDTSFDMRFLHHETTGWTYHASAFIPGGDVMGQWTTVFTQDNDLKNGVNFAGRMVLSQQILGNDSEGFLIEITTGANNSIQSMDLHVDAIL